MPAQNGIMIVGAGPSGLACTIVLARAGRQVVVREWKPNVGHRFHDDFQGLENWTRDEDVLDELAGAGINTDFERHVFVAGTVFDPSGRRFEVRGKRPLFYLLRRGAAEGTLDRALLSQAQAAGVEVRFNDRVRDFGEVGGAGVLAAGPRQAEIIAAGHLFETDMLDGAWTRCCIRWLCVSAGTRRAGHSRQVHVYRFSRSGETRGRCRLRGAGIVRRWSIQAAIMSIATVSGASTAITQTRYSRSVYEKSA